MDVTFQAPSAQKANGYGHSTPNLVRYLAPHGINLKTDMEPREIGVSYGYPRNLRLLQTKKKICFTMFESDKMPHSWKEDLALADVIVVPSHFCQRAMKKLGFDSIVVPLGIEHDVWPFLERPKRETFTFLQYESCNVRKGWFELFEAFKMAFGDREDVRIIYKTVREKNVIPLHEYPNQEVRKGAVDRKGLLDLLYEADAFVFPSMGEGFGHPPLEAIATGLPVIAPNAHGIAEYFDPRYMDYVDTEPMKARYDHIKEPTGNYARCVPKSLAQSMRHVYLHFGADHPKWSRYRREGRDWVMQNWTYKRTAWELAKIIKDL